MRETFIQQCINMGMDYVDVKDFLEDKGIVENNVEIVIDYMKHHGYVNPLRKQINKQS